MRTNYPTAISTRSEQTKTGPNAAVGSNVASNKGKSMVADRDFSDADAWPLNDVTPTTSVSTSNQYDDQRTETDPLHQGYFAEWINEAEVSESFAPSPEPPSIEIEVENGPAIPLSQDLLVAPTAVAAEPTLSVEKQRPALDQFVTEGSAQKRPLERLAAVAAPVPVNPPVSTAESNTVDLTLAEPEGIEEPARQTGGYEALSPELLAVEQPETVAFDREILAHDATDRASLEQLDQPSSSSDWGRDRTKDRANNKRKASKILGMFDRPESSVQSMAVRTVDHPHLLVAEHPHTLFGNETGIEGNPKRKAAVLGLVAVVAIASVGVSLQRNRASEPAFDVASVVEAAPENAELRSQVLNDNIEVPQAEPENAELRSQVLNDDIEVPQLATKIEPATTASGPDLEARKAPRSAIVGAPTTTGETTAAAPPKVPATTGAPAVTVEEEATAASSETETAVEVTTADNEISADEKSAESPNATVKDETAPTVDDETSLTVDDETSLMVDDETSLMVDDETSPTVGAETSVVADQTTATAETTATAAEATSEGWVDSGYGVSLPAVLLDIRYCESRDDYTAANPSSSARGGYQFLTGSWADYGHADSYGVTQAHLATPAQQDEAALKTWQAAGTTPWNASKSCWSKNPVS